MRKLAIPQTYVAGASDDDPGLRVIAVQPKGSAEAALQALVIAEPGCALGLASLARAQPELAVALYRLIDELDGLAYRHPEQGLLPLAGEPLCAQPARGLARCRCRRCARSGHGGGMAHLVRRRRPTLVGWAERHHRPGPLAAGRPAAGAGHPHRGDHLPDHPAAGCPAGDPADPAPAACRHGRSTAPGDRRGPSGAQAGGVAVRRRSPGAAAAGGQD